MLARVVVAMEASMDFSMRCRWLTICSSSQLGCGPSGRNSSVTPHLSRKTATSCRTRRVRFGLFAASSSWTISRFQG